MSEAEMGVQNPPEFGVKTGSNPGTWHQTELGIGDEQGGKSEDGRPHPGVFLKCLTSNPSWTTNHEACPVSIAAAWSVTGASLV